MSRTPDQMINVKARANASAAHGFFRQGLFILLPVGILAVVGLYSLRQDRLLAEAEARQTAQRFADDLARGIRARLRSTERIQDPRCLSFRLDAQGNLAFPPPAPAVPAPHPLNLEGLEARQAADWRTVFGPADDATARGAAVAAAQRLLASSPGPERAAPVQYRLGLLLAAEGRTNDALSAWRAVETNHPMAVTESGLPLRPLAQLKQLEWMAPEKSSGSPREQALLDGVCSN